MPEWAQPHDERGMLGKTNRLMGQESNHPHPIEWDETLETPVTNLNGVLMKVTPFGENGGAEAGVGLARALHDEVNQPTISIEAWFEEGYIHFYVYAENEDAAEMVRRKVRNWYPDSEIVTIDSGHGFIRIRKGEHISAALVTQQHPLDFLPIFTPEEKAWEADNPYQEVLSEMVAGGDTRVMIQTVMKALPKSWTDGGGRHGSVEYAANDLETADVKGWIPGVTIREIEPTDLEELQAKIVREQKRNPAYEVNYRVLAVSSDSVDAATRVEGIGSSFDTEYDAEGGQGLTAKPITARTQIAQRQQLQEFLTQMRYRILDSDSADHMMFHEVGGTSHVPNEEIGTRQIKWQRTRSGSEIPQDAAGKQRFKRD